MENVMKLAWTIARKGQKKFGGKVSEYLSVAMQQAWAIVKKEAAATEVLLAHKSNGVQGALLMHPDATVHIDTVAPAIGQLGELKDGRAAMLYRYNAKDTTRFIANFRGYTYVFEFNGNNPYCTLVRKSA